MQNRDILWAISIPFRMHNTKEMDINTYTFTLSFDAALPNCNVSTARKLVNIALEKGWIEKAKNTNILRAKFELWQPKLFPPAWKPDFSNLEKIPKISLIPIEVVHEYKPQLQKYIKKPSINEITPIFISKSAKNDREIEKEEEEEINTEEKPEKKEKITEEKKKSSSKKKAVKKQEKQKGQKSIQDFFR